MPSLNKRALLPAALIALASDGALAAASPSVIHVECQDALRPGLCAGVAETLAQRFPDHLIVTKGDPEQSRGTVLRVVTDYPRSDEVSGHLQWITADGETGQSRALHMSVMDADLTAAMLREFGANLASLFPSSH